MRPFGRHRKLLKLVASATFVFLIYIHARPTTPKHETIRCLTGSCDNAAVTAVTQDHSRIVEIEQKLRVSSLQNYTVVSKPIHPGIVVYNRVPKCASSTVRFVITKLKKKHKFLYKIHNWPNVKQSLSPTEEVRPLQSKHRPLQWPFHSRKAFPALQRDLVQEVVALRRPALFLRHLHFVDFGKYNVTQPAYINVIRDPVDRFVSHYYFSRYGFEGWTEEKIKKWLWPMSEEARNMSLDECVKRGAAKCVKESKENMLNFFCGQDERCKEHNDWSLERAKVNIAKNYVFVGILERLEDSLKALEILLPHYFGGAVSIYQNSLNEARHTKTARKKEPSDDTRAELKKTLKREIELYEFVKTRFEIQFDALKSSGYIQ